jgi:hypothetical protein
MSIQDKTTTTKKHATQFLRLVEETHGLRRHVCAERTEEKKRMKLGFRCQQEIESVKIQALPKKRAPIDDDGAAVRAGTFAGDEGEMAPPSLPKNFV